MEPAIVKKKISPALLKRATEEGFGIMVKVAVDIKKEILALGGEWHSEGQYLLVRKEGSQGQEVWGVNFYPYEKGEKRIEYIALINIKPALHNRSMKIQDPSVRHKIKAIAEKLLLEEDETLIP
ncbi:MAG: hypothetical protein HYZ69_00105 [Candidatus Colwellbacteria bacterium]|nr:hypothetical protein [Candidatus Colwellbacteria bacterium]